VQPEVEEEVEEEPEVEETEEETETESEPEDTFDGGQFNPDELPEELRPAWRQLQGAFTRKTQELSARLKEVEALAALEVDVETATHAVGLYNRINDPSNWPALYEQLGQVMEQHGMELPGRAPAGAPAGPVAPGTDDAALDALVEADPDLAPLVATIRAQRAELARVDSVQARLDAFDAERQAAMQEAEQLRVQAAEIQAIQAQESQLREAFSLKDEDVDMIYNVSTSTEGDLLKAHEVLEAYVQARAERMLAGKGRPKKAAAPAAPKSKAKPEAPKAEETLEDITAELEEHLRTLQRAGELDSV